MTDTSLSPYLREPTREPMRAALEIAVKELRAIAGRDPDLLIQCRCDACRAASAVANIEAIVPDAREWR